MKALRIGHIVLNVKTLDRAARFYIDVLGFEEAYRLERPRSVFLTLGTQHHDIALFELEPGAPDLRDNQVGLHHLALDVGSVNALKQAHSELEQHGLAILRAVDHGTTHSVYFRDPDGNQLELYCEIRGDGLAYARSRSVRTVDDFPALKFD